MERVDEPVYQSLVRAQIRRPAGWTSSGTWTYLKGGLSGIQVRVYPGEVRVGQAGGAARRLFSDYSFASYATIMRLERIGWLGTTLLARDCIVLSCVDSDASSGEIEVAFRPVQGDLRQAWEALASVGVRGET